MSFEDSPDCLFGDDQSQAVPHESDNIFDEVFDQRLYDVENLVDSHDQTNEIIHLYAGDEHQEDYPRLPSLSGSTSNETSNGRSPPQPWRKGLWCLNQDSLTINKTRKPIMETVATSQLVSNPTVLIRSPPPPSLSPTVKTTKRFVTSPNAAKHRHKGLAKLPFSRENTLSPSPMYAQLPLQSKMEQVETWQQDFKNFNLQSSQIRTRVEPRNAQPDHVSRPHDQSALLASQNDLPHESNNHAYYDQSNFMRFAQQGYVDKNIHGLAIEPQFANHSNVTTPATAQFQPRQKPVWTTESLHSSNSSHQSSYDTLPPSLSSGLSSNGLPMGQVWWSPEMGPPTPRWATTAQEPFPTIAAPTPKRAVTQSFADDIDRRTEGLGIQYGDYPMPTGYMDANLVYQSVETAASQAYSPRRADHATGIPPVPPLPFPLPSQPFTNASPFTSPHAVRRSPTRAPSPSVSPLSMTPRSRRANRSPSRPDQPTHNHHRRKSIHKPGPIKSTANTTVEEALPSANSTRARSRSQSKPPRTPKTPKTPTGGFNVEFVNFTALDASKLQSDVAPSGSRKTRERREAEARDKRKKLSEAALKAVTSAGGDAASLEILKKAILA